MMNWLKRRFTARSRLSLPQQQQLAAWQALPSVPLKAPVRRCVVVDVETSGLNLLEDRLISVGAVAVVEGKIVLGDSFYVVIQQDKVSDKNNILLHGIGNAAQTTGEPPAEALLNFLAYLQKDPLIAFHVTFDQTMIRRALRQYLGFSFQHPWLDMAYLMPALNPALAARYRSLDDWIGHFGIQNDQRHNAQADAQVTAQLFQVALAQSAARKVQNFSAFQDLEKAQRWVAQIS